MDAIVDNDILIKGACYGVLGELVSGASQSITVGVLGSALFVVPKRIEKCELKGNRNRALETFMNFVTQVTALEPADDEQKMAADLELTAQKSGVSLDSGESQLCAILCLRVLPLLMTGDKRAIVAMERLLDSDPRLAHLYGKVRCLEQLFATLLVKDRNGMLRKAVCTEPSVDKTLSTCFSCHCDDPPEGDYMEGLQSYVRDLRRVASRVLSP